MNKIIQNVFQKAKEPRLTSDEREAMREALVSFMRLHPVRNAAPARPLWQRSPFFLVRKPMPIALVLVFLFGASGISFAAEQALPGDALYAVKVQVNEPGRALFAFSSEAKAEWEARRAERRLEEAEELALAGTLDEATAAVLEAKFSAHAQRMRVIVEKMEAKGNIEAAAALHAGLGVSLRVHEQVLARFEAAQSLAQAVSAQGSASDAAQQESETKVASGPQPAVKTAAEGRLKAAENKIAEVRRFLELQTNRLGLSDAEAKLKSAEDFVAEGKTKIGEGAYGEAFVLFQKAHRTAQEAKLLAIAQLKFGGEDEPEEPVEEPAEEEPQEEPEERDNNGNNNDNDDNNNDDSGGQSVEAQGSGRARIPPWVPFLR